MWTAAKLHDKKKCRKSWIARDKLKLCFFTETRLPTYFSKNVRSCVFFDLQIVVILAAQHTQQASRVVALVEFSFFNHAVGDHSVQLLVYM